MANCPKCGAHLKLTDWRPTCPHCGINLIYYGMEERLLEDADKAESEHAVFQKKLDRLKASFIGSPLTIIRIVLSLLPIGALMLPLANVSFWGPFFEKKVSVNAITIYNAVSALDFDALFKYIGSGSAHPRQPHYAHDGMLEARQSPQHHPQQHHACARDGLDSLLQLFLKGSREVLP